MIKPANIVLTLVSTAVVGGAAWSLSHPPKPQQVDDDWGGGPSTQVAEGQSYPNNYYVPGAGYYHAPYHSFFPFQYNFFDSSRGYYYGGSWSPRPYSSGITSSIPTHQAVTQARSAFASSRSSSGFSSHGSSSSSMGHSSSSSVSHGGFGSTAHGSSSSS